MRNDRSSAQSPASALLRALRWRPVTYKQAWLFAPLIGLSGLLGWLVAGLWTGSHRDWGFALAFAVYAVLLSGVVWSRKIRRRAAASRAAQLPE